MNRNHRAFNNVSGAALHRGVNRRAFGILATQAVTGVDFWKIQTPAENGFNVTIFFGLLAGIVHVISDTGIAFEIGFHIFGSLMTFDAQLFG